MRNLPVIFHNNDTMNNLKKKDKDQEQKTSATTKDNLTEIQKEQPTENEKLTCNLPDESELICERQVT